MELHASGEDYLEAVLVLEKKLGTGQVRSIDLARHLEFSKPSVSHAVTLLRRGGFLEMDAEGLLSLTALGREVAEKIYARHRFFARYLMDAGVDPEIADHEACRMEHVISEKSFQLLEKKYGKE